MSAEVSFPINYEAATEVVVNKPKEPVASASTEELLTVRQAAKRYNVTPNTIRKWIACDLVAAIRVGPYRRIRLRASDIEAKH